MAEHIQSGRTELGAPMDYAEHERTFDRFIMLTKVTVLASIDTVLALALFAFGGGAGFWLGTLILVLMTIGLVIGLATNGNMKPLIAVTVIALVLLALTAG